MNEYYFFCPLQLGDKMNPHEIRLEGPYLDFQGKFKSDVFIEKVPSQAFFMIRKLKS